MSAKKKGVRQTGATEKIWKYLLDFTNPEDTSHEDFVKTTKVTCSETLFQKVQGQFLFVMCYKDYCPASAMDATNPPYDLLPTPQKRGMVKKRLSVIRDRGVRIKGEGNAVHIYPPNLVPKKATPMAEAKPAGNKPWAAKKAKAKAAGMTLQEYQASIAVKSVPRMQVKPTLHLRPVMKRLAYATPAKKPKGVTEVDALRAENDYLRWRIKGADRGYIDKLIAEEASKE